MWEKIKESFETPDSYVSLALGLAVVLVVGMITFNYFKAKMQPGLTGDKKTEASQAATMLPAKHTVVEGETLWSISEKYYKTGYNWVDIQKANDISNPDSIENGQTLTIPDTKPIMPSGEVSSATTEKKSYTVVKGDSLWSIAVKNYNDGYKWVAIAEANHLVHPDTIHSGNVLVMP
jgi:nucleoid-associated protein YgaU